MDFREQVQKEAVETLLKHGNGTGNISMRLGKTKIGLDISSNYKKVIVSYPNKTIKESWVNDAQKFNIDISKITFTTHLSLYKYNLEEFDCLIIDEIHSFSDQNWSNLAGTSLTTIYGLTATPPQSWNKLKCLKVHCPIRYTKTMDETTNITNKDYEIYVHLLEPSSIRDIPLKSGKFWSEKAKIKFFENKVLFKCVEPLPILEKEICGTIDGSTDSYELIRVYTRNPLTGVLSVIHYEDNFGNVVSGTIVEVCCDCNTLCEVTPSLLPVNMRCDSYSRSTNVNHNLQNQGGWLSGYNNTLYFDKWSNTATYDLLMNDLGQPGLVGAPRNLQYQISGEINGNTFSGTITIPVPTSGTPLSLANQINAIVGANVLDYDGYGWSFQYNNAWTSYSLLIGEHADNHVGGFQDISFGWRWAVRLNGGVLEDGIGVDPNNLNNGNWFSTVNCISI